MKRMNEQELLALTAQNKEDGFRVLMTMYEELVYWHIRRLVVNHEDAQDASQETFVRIFKSLARFKGDCSLRSWIYRIATNEALRLLDKRKNVEEQLDEQLAGHNVAADGYVNYENVEAVKLQKAILSLPTKQQLVFNLRYYDELSYEEIAEAACSTATAAKANYYVAKGKIIEYMNSHD